MERKRVGSVDAWRGLVMMIMAIDHVRDFCNWQRINPENLAQSTPALFFTRWITHFCAPVFSFSAGIGAWLWLSRGRTKPELTRFLLSRGLWLVFLELTWIHVSIAFSFSYQTVILTVLWALGWSMIVLAFAIYLPRIVLAAVSLLTIALHNLADPVTGGWFWDILHQRATFPFAGSTIVVGYPLVPWVAVMAAGFAFGPVFSMEPQRRRRVMVGCGAALTVAFVVIRGINLYGDPFPWTFRVPGMAVEDFLNCTKYPPSLDFLLMTMGPALLMLAWLDGLEFAKTSPLMVFGRVPMFYFLIHFLAAQLLSFPMTIVRNWLGAKTVGSDLALVYGLWLVLLGMMYPLCLWFARLKERRRDWWLGYL